VFLGIDVGTGGVRACAIDARAEILSTAAAPLPAPRQHGDAIDQAPELWWRAMVVAIGRLGEAVDLGRVARIAVDGTSGTLLLIDADGKPRSPGAHVQRCARRERGPRVSPLSLRRRAAHLQSAVLRLFSGLRLSSRPYRDRRMHYHAQRCEACQLQCRPKVRSRSSRRKIVWMIPPHFAL
jgi:sugar (pentulose or hexulose) kinase